MFGKSPFGATSTSAFGGGNSLFGSTPNRPTSGFGVQSTQSTGGLFGQKPLFGSTPQTTSLFSSSQPASTASTSLFGQAKPLFGSSSTTQATGFNTTGSLFGSTQSTSQSGGLFGTGFGSSAITGTTVKFEPPTGTDTMLRNGSNQTINTKHVCITAMKQYENKSLEELRCEDYLANRKGVQSGVIAGGLNFAQSSQPSTSSGLFSSVPAPAQQSSLFGQNKPLFGGATSGFGAVTTTSSSLFGTPAPSTSIFGNKPVTGGLFGNTSTPSHFGQVPTSTGLFGAKPTTGFGTQSTSLFGGSGFGAATTAPSTFSFGASTTTATPFGQAQPAFSSFSGFQQPTVTAATGGLFGAKPATSSFGAFGTPASTPSLFGTQQSTGGLFGSKPATGGLFGSAPAGNLFGQPAASTATSFFGSTASKPTGSLFGSMSSQPAFGTPQMATNVAGMSAAPIVLGANVSQTLLENAMIEAQLASCPYGDSPLLKLLTSDTMERADIPNPVSVNRQMRFLASRAESGALTSTTPSGPLALGSIPAAGSRLGTPTSALKVRNSLSDFSYRSMFSPPVLRSGRNTSLLSNGDRSDNRSFHSTHSTNNAVVTPESRGKDTADLGLQKPRRSNVKKLDLSVVHKAVQEGKSRLSSSDSFPQRLIGLRDSNARGVTAADASSQTNHASIGKESTTITLSEDVSNIGQLASENGHSARFTLKRPDYECEPPLAVLKMMAEENAGVCHIESGFTIRRLAFGSVFWPGPFDLHSIDLDEVVHFRQHEIIVYPDDNVKPPVGEQLNRFAEVSLERVWPRDKKTKEFITDPTRLEEIGFRAKLERASNRMGAKFKDYRMETGSWVFTVPHFTKYGLMDCDDDDMPDEKQLLASFDESKRQYSVQRSRLSQIESPADLANHISASSNVDNKKLEDSSDAYDIGDPSSFVRGLGGTYKAESRIDDVQNFGNENSMFSEFMHPLSSLSKDNEIELFDKKMILKNVMKDSLAIIEPKDGNVRQLRPKIIEPIHKLEHMMKENQSICAKFNCIINDCFLNRRRCRIGWFNGRTFIRSDLPTSFSVKIARVDCQMNFSQEYIEELQEFNLKLLSRPDLVKMDDMKKRFVPRREPMGSFGEVIKSYMSISKKHEVVHDLNVWSLCDALFGSRFTDHDDCVKAFRQRERVADWLRDKLRENWNAQKLLTGEKQHCILERILFGDIEGAIDEAVDSNYPHLALSLSSFQFSTENHHAEQIIHWDKISESKFIDTDLLKVHMIMAGYTHFETQDKIIYVNDGLDDLQAFAIFVWYYKPFNASLDDVLNAFKDDLHLRKGSSDLPCDVFFELIQLTCDRSRSLEEVIEPNLPSVHFMDYHLSWHLWYVLFLVGYRHLSKPAEHTLHVRYSEQLNQMNLRHLAAHVLMYIDDTRGRYDAVTEMVDRFGVDANDELYGRLEVVGVPFEVISHSKYMRAKVNGNEEDMCLFALECGMFDEAHKLFVEMVGPNAIVTDNFVFLNQLSDHFERVSDSIPAWGPRGQIFTDFCLLKKRMDDLSDDSEIEEVLPLVHSIELRLTTLPLKTPLQRICASIMARYIFKFIYGFESVETENLPFDAETETNIASELMENYIKNEGSIVT